MMLTGNKLCGVLPVMEVVVIGLVEGKRKRADGSIHFAIHPLFLCFTPTGVCESSLPQPRVIQMVCNSTTRTFPEILPSHDLLSLITTGSYIQGIGICLTNSFEERKTIQQGEGGGSCHKREKYILSHLRLLRISPYPEHLSKVVSFARSLSLTPTANTLDSTEIYQFYNEIISPKPLELSQDSSMIISSFHSSCLSSSPPAMDYLSTLMTTQSAIKTHCHLMTTYHSNNRGSLKGMNLEVLDGGETGLIDYDLVKRPPRRRNRKISTQEKLTLQIYELFANQLLREYSATEESVSDEHVSLNPHLVCGCTDDVEPISSFDDLLVSSADNSVVNLPAGDLAAPSHRGQFTRGEYLNDKKYPQIHWMTRRLLEMVQRFQFHQRHDSRLHIIDIGGGRGDLSVSLALALERYLPHRYHVSVLDLNEKSLLAGKEYATACQLSQQISFHNLDFRDFVLKQLSTGEVSSPFFTSPTEASDLFLVVGLHICGDLTDLAMEYVRTLSASRCCGFLIVPCCYSKCCLNEAGTEDKLASEMEWRGWVHESRGVQSLIESNTLSLSAGGEISHDWFSPMTSEKCTVMRRTLCTLAESNPRESQWRAMMIINILRICHLIRTLNGTNSEVENGKWNLSLESFARQHSLRNIVICGEHRYLVSESSAKLRDSAGQENS
jgi:hypothetical protein